MDRRQPARDRLLHDRRQTLEIATADRRRPGNDTRLVSIDIATGATTDVPAGPGVKFNPSFLPANDIGYIRKDSGRPGHLLHERQHADRRAMSGAASWSPDGTRVVFHRRLTAPPTTW